MARRSYGTGSLYVRTNAAGQESWHGRWYIGNRRVKRKLGPKRAPGARRGLSRAQAEKKLREAMESTQAPAVELGSQSVGKVGRRMVVHLEAQGRKASTLSAYETSLRCHLGPHFASKPLVRIDVEAVEAFIAALSAKGLAPKSIRNHVGALHSIFEYARVRPNPVVDARKPEVDYSDPDIRYLDATELEAVLRHVADDHLGPVEQALYLTAAMTGLRQGELFALRWRDVDWGAMRIRVRRSYARKRSGREAQFGKPKSRRASRSVPMHDRVGAALEEHSRRSAYRGDDDLVFAHPHSGSPLDGSRITKRFKAALDAAGVRKVRFHDLRHTFGTRMAAAGVPMRTLQEWMGHRDIKTTMIYADYSPSDHEGAMIAGAFDAGSPGPGPIRGPKLSATEQP